MNLGVIRGESMKDYHASPAVSWSKLRVFMGNFPAYYRARFVDRAIDGTDSEAFAFGRYFHTLALEGPNAAAAAYAVSPGFDRRTKAGKAAAEEFETLHAGKETVGADDAILAARMATSIQDNPTAMQLLSAGGQEVTFRNAKIPEMPMQCRPDWFNPEACDITAGYPYVVNLKTIEHLHEDWPRQFHKFGYHMGEAFCRSVIADTLPASARPTRHYFIVVEKSEPFACQVFEPGEITMDTARQHIESALKRLLACYKSGDWPKAPAGVTYIDAPEYWNIKGAA